MEALGLPFFQRALAAGLLASLACGLVGSWVVVKEVSSLSGGLAHAAFGGLGLGYLLGVDPMLGAALFALAAGLGLGVAHRRLDHGLETLVMMVWSVGMALGIVFVAAVPGYAPDLTGYLFGNILFVPSRYLWLVAALDLLLLLCLARWYRPFRAVAFDEEFAEVAGLRVEAVLLGSMALTSLVVVLLIRVVGVLLVIALLTLPASLARHWSRTLKGMMALASLAGAVFITGGLLAAQGLSGGLGVEVPTGPLVVLLAAAGFGLSAWLRGRRDPIFGSRAGASGGGDAGGRVTERSLPAAGAPLLLGAALLLPLGDAAGAPGAELAAQEVREDTLSRPRVRDVGLAIGVLEPGRWNAITDVPGVRVGHATLREGDSLRTGVTAVLPHGGDLFRRKVPAAIEVGNGFGKLVGLSQVDELGEIETPILLTGTLSVFRVADALVDTLLRMPGHEEIRSINPVVGETNDGWLSDIRARPVGPGEVRRALREARSGPVREGSVGAGTGTRALGWKGGIGTASRRVRLEGVTRTVGVLVQSNYGGRLTVGGVPVWRELEREEAVGRRDPAARGEEGDGPRKGEGEGPSGTAKPAHDALGGGSVMIVVATDAPLAPNELRRLARRTFLGIGRTGSWMSHGSGDYAIAFSTVPDGAETEPVRDGRSLSLLFQAVVEATEEAALNALFRATTVTGYRGRTVRALPLDPVLEALGRAGRLDP